MKKTLFLSLLCGLLTAGFAACSDDDGGNGGGGNGGGNGGNDGNDSVITPGGGGGEGLDVAFRVTSISGDEDATFNYTDNLLTSGTFDNGWGQCNITRNPLVLTTRHQYDTEYSEETVSNIRLNANGFITSANYSMTDHYEEGNVSGSGTIRITYTPDGRHIAEKQVSLNGTDPEYGNWTEAYTLSYKWNADGNLTEIVLNENYVDIEENYTYSEQYTYTYDADSTLYPNTGIFLTEMKYMTYDYMWYAGLLGNTTRNIPTSIHKKETEDGEPIYEYTQAIQPTYNSDGSIATLEYDGYPYLSFGYGNNSAVQPTQKTAASMRGNIMPSPSKRLHERLKARLHK